MQSLNYYLNKDLHLLQQPSAVRGDASVHIGEVTGAGNDPGHGSDDVSSSHDWATGVSHAHALVVSGQGADGVVEHERTVVGGVTGTAVGQGQGLGVQDHQVSGSRAGVLQGGAKRKKTKVSHLHNHHSSCLLTEVCPQPVMMAATPPPIWFCPMLMGWTRALKAMAAAVCTQEMSLAIVLAL